ncbi:putative E3 ubiquitin-protein ligase HIP1 isoform X2 [Tasmannia lanceolata]|uniref:putative E3 ubiquitin-protein ligase HIP1 isoform X2 n=1 Tax=Tasmannia lanceolata TaxID=3420 RepID=UPI0040647FDB
MHAQFGPHLGESCTIPYCVVLKLKSFQGENILALMQGQRSTVQSLPETFEFGSTSNNADMDLELYWNNLLNPVDGRGLVDYPLSPDTNISYVNAVNHDSGNLNNWNLGGSSSGDHTSSQPGNDEANIVSLESENINIDSNQAANEPLLLQNSNSDDIPQSRNLNSGFVGNDGQVMGSETEQIPSASGSTVPLVTASGTVDYSAENGDGRLGCSPDGQRLSCKRKAVEEVSGQPSLGGSSSIAENSVWHGIPAQHDAASSSSISSPAGHLSGVNEGQLNTRFGVNGAGMTSDYHHGSSSTAGNAENLHRNFRMRINPPHQQDSATLNLQPPGNAVRRSDVWPPVYSPSQLLSFHRSLDLRSTTNIPSYPQHHSLVPHIPNFPGCTENPYPYFGGPNPHHSLVPNITSSNSPVIVGERLSALREEPNLRSMPRSVSEHPMYVPATAMRNLTQDPIQWSQVNRNISVPENIASSSRIGSSSVFRPSLGSTWVPNPGPPGQHPRRLPEVVRRSMFPTTGTESPAQSNAFPLLRSVASTSSQMMVLPSGVSHPGNQGHPPYRPEFSMDRQGDGVPGVPSSLRSLPAPVARRRLSTEVRNALDLIRRGENLRFEDILILDRSVFVGTADGHDRHRDMRLDVDNMSYEELLALEEQIGNVSTGLNEETVLKCLKQGKYVPIAVEAPPEVEPCCICQEEYVEGDELGKLDCGHDFHAACIKQWLMQKNICPFCKTAALGTSD